MSSAMEFFNFFWEVMKKEQEKFNINITAADELTNIDANYDIVHNRCLYMYRYATSAFHFMHECFMKFFADYHNTPDLILKWKLCADLKLSSLSCGPALDCIALISALSKYNFSVDSPFRNVKIISKYGAWRNTLNIMLDAINNGELSIVPSLKINKDNIEVIQNNFSSLFPQKLKGVLGDSDIVMMVKTFNLASVLPEQESVIASGFQDLLADMKADSLLFFIDTKPTIDIFMRCVWRFPGTFLFAASSENIKLPVTFDEFYRDTYGCLPVLHSRGVFFVWKKLPSFTKSVPSTSMQSESVEFSFSPVPVTCSEQVNSEPLTDIQLMDKDMNTSDESQLISCKKDMSENLILPNEKNQKLKPNSTISGISQSKIKATIQPKILGEIQCPQNANTSFNQENIDKNNGTSKSPEPEEESDNSTFQLQSTSESKSSKRRSRRKAASAQNGNKVSMEPVFKDKFSQTYPESSMQKVNDSSVKQLTNRITKLVSSFEGLVPGDELHQNKTFVKNESMVKENGNGCVPHSHVADAHSHSSVNCHNNDFCRMPYRMVNCNGCHNQHGCHAYHGFHNTCILSHMHNMCNAHSCSVPNRCEQHCAHHVPSYCCASYCSEPCSREMNVPTTVPNLVIPLQNMSSDVMAQIISLLTQTPAKS